MRGRLEVRGGSLVWSLQVGDCMIEKGDYHVN